MSQFDRRTSGKVLGALGAVESVSGLVTPVWLGAVYVLLARHRHPADTFYCMVATALVAFVILLARPPKPPPPPGGILFDTIQDDSEAVI